jgi:hypothetical protein
MSDSVWYDAFVQALVDKYPKRGIVVEKLALLLNVEKEAIYRRMRKEVQFTAAEIAIIAKAWDISIDNVLGLSTNEFRFRVQFIDYINPSKDDVLTMQSIVQLLDYVKDIPDLEYVETCNMLPRMLLTGFPVLNRGSLLKWKYQSGQRGALVPFSQVSYHEETEKLTGAYHEAATKLSQVHFILDWRFLEFIIEDILYFHSLSLISDEDKLEIRAALHSLLDYMSEMAETGCWPGTNNKVFLYISQINVTTNCNYYYYNGATRLCSTILFGRNKIYSADRDITDKFRQMLQAQKKSSILISGADESRRLSFFKKQRAMVDNL